MSGRLAGATTFAVFLLVSSTHCQVNAFTTRAAVIQKVRSVPNWTPGLGFEYWAERSDLNDRTLDWRLNALDPTILDDEKPVTEKSKNPEPVLFKFCGHRSEKNAGFAAAAVLALMLFFTPLPSLAAMSGGRMGGMISEPRSSQLSRPSPGSYDRGYSSGFRSGYSGGSFSGGPRIILSPFATPYGAPFYSPGGFYGGPRVITYSSGPSFFSLLIFGAFAFTAISAMSSIMQRNTFSSWDISSSSGASSALGPGTSVVQVTVGLEVPNRDDRTSILSVLGRLLKTSQTDSRVGIQNLTSQGT